MYCYKLNNSYTIYVNYYYINQCRKAAQKARKEREIEATAFYYNRTPISCLNGKAQGKKPVAPLPNNTVVNHKSFGKGIIVETSLNGYVVVSFNEQNIKFQYPQAFDLGYLSCVSK